MTRVTAADIWGHRSSLRKEMLEEPSNGEKFDVWAQPMVFHPLRQSLMELGAYDRFSVLVSHLIDFDHLDPGLPVYAGRGTKIGVAIRTDAWEYREWDRSIFCKRLGKRPTVAFAQSVENLKPK